MAVAGVRFEDFGDIDPFTVVGGFNPTSQDPEGNQIPSIFTGSFSVAQRIGWGNVLEASYVTTQARHLPQRIDINEIQPGQLTGVINGADLSDPVVRAALTDSVVNSFRPFPDFGDVIFTQFTGTSTYHSLQVTLSRQQSENLQYFVNYTFSKALGTLATNETGSNIDPIDTRNRAYGVLPYDRTHIFNASYVWQIASGARGPFDNAFGRGVLEGWQLSGITSYQSGLPIQFGLGGNQGIRYTGAYSDDNTRQGYFAGGTGGAQGLIYLNDPRAGGSDVGEYVVRASSLALPGFGDLGTVQSPFYLRGQGRFNTDLTFFKFFKITESQNIEFRTGIFNIFNQAFANPNLLDYDLQLQTDCNVRVNGVPDGTGGTVDNVCDPRGGYRILNEDTFGRVVNKHGRRVIEFALKYNF
jgi:hypothetical protein